MQTSKTGFDLIKHYEGLKLTAYPDPATGSTPWTIGYGSTAGVKQGMKINESQANSMLRADVAKFEKDINRLVKVKLTQSQFDALVSFVYNLGPTNFANSTLLTQLNAGNYKLVPDQIRRWNKANGKVMAGLVRRRESEAKLFETGKLNF